MDVYLIPVGSISKARYELYCEDAGDLENEAAEVNPTGRFAKLYESFKTALARVERRRKSGARAAGGRPLSWTEKIKDRALCWIAERIAEQRLLWRLRKETDANLFYPDDVTAEQSMDIARAMLQREAEHHLKWTVIDGLLLSLSAVAMLVPGPNVLAYYFGFQLVGHYLSRRGARQGLDVVQWSQCPSAQLSRLRQAIGLGANERVRQVHEVASELHLPHLATFVERTSVRTA